MIALQECLEFGWVMFFREILIASNYKTASFACNVREGCLPAVATVGGGSEVDFNALLIQRHSCKRHVVLPANQSPDFTDRRIKHIEIASLSLSPNDALSGRRFDLAVTMQKISFRTEVQQRAI